MVDRIRAVMEHLGQTNSQFADSIDIPRAVLSHIISGRNKPSLDVIVRLLAKHKKINPNWLLHGEGEMLITLASKTASNSKIELPETPLDKYEEVKPEQSPEVEKIQNGKPTVEELPLPVSSSKKVKQVILVYADNTFTALTPGD